MSSPKPPRRPRPAPGADGPPVIPSPRAASPRAPAPSPAPPVPPTSPPDREEGARKLIRPALTERPARHAQGAPPARRREPPSEVTGAEDALLGRAASLGLVVSVRLVTGDVVEGRIEWIDRGCLKLRGSDGAGVVVMKHAVTSVTLPPPARRG